MSGTYEQWEKTMKLNELLKSSYAIKQVHNGDIEAVEADLLWNSSRFWAQVIYSCRPFKHECSYDDFLEFKRSYETQTNTRINVDELQSKFWLRNVLQ